MEHILTEDPIDLRGHHLIGLRGYVYAIEFDGVAPENLRNRLSDGYGEELIMLSDHLRESLYQNPYTKIRLIDGVPDLLCDACNMRDDSCFSKDDITDRLLAQDLGVQIGDVITMQDVIDYVRKQVAKGHVFLY